MPLSALALVLLAAVPHATWNIAAKRAGAGQRFTLNTSLLTSLLWLPADFAVWLARGAALGLVGVERRQCQSASAPMRECAGAPMHPPYFNRVRRIRQGVGINQE